MTAMVLLASEGIQDKTWWNPYLKGSLIAVLAVALFVGSAYLLLYTNVGSRLGFLLTASATAGFIWLLSIAWITGQFPNGPLGPAPGWDVREVVAAPAESSFDTVHTIQTEGTPASTEQEGQIQADLEVELTAVGGEFQQFQRATDFLVENVYTQGGERRWPFWWTRHTTYAAIEICPATTPPVPFGEIPEPAECTPGEPTRWIVMLEDLGARRLPAFYIFAASGLLFLLSLYALSVYERDQQRAAAGPPTDGSDGASDGDGTGNGSGGTREPEPAGV